MTHAHVPHRPQRPRPPFSREARSLALRPPDSELEERVGATVYIDIELLPAWRMDMAHMTRLLRRFLCPKYPAPFQPPRFLLVPSLAHHISRLRE